MPRESLRDQIRQLKAEATVLQKGLEAEQKAHAQELQLLKAETLAERRTRAAAQRGLVPYVRGLEQLDKWLLQRPELRHELEPILREQGLWEIRLGYDPDQDLGMYREGPLVRNAGAMA